MNLVLKWALFVLVNSLCDTLSFSLSAGQLLKGSFSVQQVSVVVETARVIIFSRLDNHGI